MEQRNHAKYFVDYGIPSSVMWLLTQTILTGITN